MLVLPSLLKARHFNQIRKFGQPQIVFFCCRRTSQPPVEFCCRRERFAPPAFPALFSGRFLLEQTQQLNGRRPVNGSAAELVLQVVELLCRFSFVKLGE
jgi:hypothetical protein